MPLSEWSVDDVLALVAERVEEGQRLDDKGDLHLDNPKERREAAKDASGFANAQGGLLIYGVAEEELPDGRRLPTEPTPLQDGAAQSRLEDVLDAAVTPTLNFRTRLLETDGGFFLLVRVFQRAGPPHMVSAYGDNRHYVRAGLKTRPMEQHEVEVAYRVVSQGEARSLRRLHKLPLIPRLEDVQYVEGRGAVPGSVWAGVVTAPLDFDGLLLDTRAAGANDFPDDGEHPRWWTESVIWGGLAWDSFGYLDETPDVGHLSRRVRLYREGICEWGYAYTGSDAPAIPFASQVHDALAYFAGVYARVGYFGRLRTWITLDNTYGASLLRPQTIAPFHSKKLEVKRLEWTTDDNVERLHHDVVPTVHAAMDRSHGASNVVSSLGTTASTATRASCLRAGRAPEHTRGAHPGPRRSTRAAQRRRAQRTLLGRRAGSAPPGGRGPTAPLLSAP